MVSRFAPLSEILALDDVRDVTTAVPAWDPDELWPFPAEGVGSSSVSVLQWAPTGFSRPETACVGDVRRAGVLGGGHEQCPASVGGDDSVSGGHARHEDGDALTRERDGR